MSKNPKVLVATTIYEGKDYVFDLFYNNLKKLDYDNYDILIVDNSRTKKYYSKLKRKGVPVVHVNRGLNSRVAHAKSLNKIREVFLKGDYDYWLSVESDLIPPVDIIQRLMGHDKPAVGCMYTIGYADSKSEPPRPCLFVTEQIPGEKDSFGRQQLRTRNLNPEEAYPLFGSGVMPIHGCGIGTCLIKREILEKFPFKYELNTPKVMHSDVLFYMDLHNAGIQNYVDTDVIVPHHNSNWNLVKDI